MTATLEITSRVRDPALDLYYGPIADLPPVDGPPEISESNLASTEDLGFGMNSLDLEEMWALGSAATQMADRFGSDLGRTVRKAKAVTGASVLLALSPAITSCNSCSSLGFQNNGGDIIVDPEVSVDDQDHYPTFNLTITRPHGKPHTQYYSGYGPLNLGVLPKGTEVEGEIEVKEKKASDGTVLVHEEKESCGSDTVA
jgi:hypothetical protein